MEVKEAVLSRRSIRAFRPDPVPRVVLEEIMETALWAPSWGNTQPWGFTVVGGQTLERIREEYVKLYEQGVPPAPELHMPTEFNQVQTARYKALGKSLFSALGIGREDREKRRAYGREMTSFFRAPCVVYLHLERGFDPYALMDGGLILQTIALLAVDKGLGTCFLARSVQYPQVVRKHAPIPDDRVLVMGLAIGYPEAGHPANTFPRVRGAPEEFIQWVDLS
jgi:nitroreductase